jgi:hypothetical protein
MVRRGIQPDFSGVPGQQPRNQCEALLKRCWAKVLFARTLLNERTDLVGTPERLYKDSWNATVSVASCRGRRSVPDGRTGSADLLRRSEYNDDEMPLLQRRA